MATERQIAANRRNALKSTGPRTPEGKSSSSRNATVTGLFSRHAVVDGAEDPEEFQALVDSLIAEFQPATTHQQILIVRYARLLWISQRVSRIQCAVIAAHLDSATQDLWGPQPPPDDPAACDNLVSMAFGIAWTRDAAAARTLDRLQKHAAIVERQIGGALRLIHRTIPQTQNCHNEPNVPAEPETPCPPAREEAPVNPTASRQGEPSPEAPCRSEPGASSEPRQPATRPNDSAHATENEPLPRHSPDPGGRTIESCHGNRRT